MLNICFEKPGAVMDNEGPSYNSTAIFHCKYCPPWSYEFLTVHIIIYIPTYHILIITL